MTDGKEPRIALKYWRRHAPEWMYCDSVADAVASAYWLVEDENGSPYEVVSVDGVVLLTEKELDARRLLYEEDARSEAAPPRVVPEINADDEAAALAFSKFMGRRVAAAADWHDLADGVKAVWRAKVKDDQSL